jgi:hypothetical protein
MVAMRIHVLDRIHERHPELEPDDVVAAFRSIMTDAERMDGTWLAVGLDGRGRTVELLYRAAGGEVLIYHAFTPPTKKFMREIARIRRQR